MRHLTVYVIYPAEGLIAIIACFGPLALLLISFLAEGLCVGVSERALACSVMSPKQIRGQF